MIKSMTGYSRCEFIYKNFKFSISIKSLNSRFLDINVNIPKEISYFESDIQSLISSYIKRGKIEFNLFIENLNKRNFSLEVNYDLIDSYIKILNDLSKRYKIDIKLALSDLIMMEGIVNSKKTLNLENDKFIKEKIVYALKKLIKMREFEGRNIYKNIKKILLETKKILAKIKKRVPQITIEYEKRLKERVLKIIDSYKFDENRILTEVAILADKIDVTEEIDRLESHLIQINDYLKSTSPVGREIEFLLQEMVREINTIGSKVSDLSVTKNVIKIKENIEKLREQIRNIE